jgi:hypothetical protein
MIGPPTVVRLVGRTFFDPAAVRDVVLMVPAARQSLRWLLTPRRSRWRSRSMSVFCWRAKPGAAPAESDELATKRACVPFINVQPNLKQTVPLGTFSARRIKGMREERRLVWRVLRHWKEIADGGRFPRRDEIDPWLRGEDGANCLLIAVGWSIELSHFIVVGVNLAGALCATDTLAGVLLSSVPQVVSSRRGLMMEGVAVLRRVDIRYRTVLLPVSEVGATIDYVLGATTYRSLRVNEVRATQVNFRRLPMPRIARNSQP